MKIQQYKSHNEFPGLHDKWSFTFFMFHERGYSFINATTTDYWKLYDDWEVDKQYRQFEVEL